MPITPLKRTLGHLGLLAPGAGQEAQPLLKILCRGSAAYGKLMQIIYETISLIAFLDRDLK